MSIPYPGETASLATALCWTFSTLCFTGASRRIGSLSVNWLRLFIAWILLAIQGLVFRGLPFPSDAPAHAWLWLSLSGFLGFFLGDLCLVKALLLIGPRLTSLLLSLAPPFAALVAIPVLGEELSPKNWLGMVLTLVGVSWVVLERKTDENGSAGAPSLGGVLLGILASLGQGAGLVLSSLGMSVGDSKYDAFAATQIRVIVGFAGFAVLLLALKWYPRLGSALKQPRALCLVAVGSFLGPFLGVALILLAVQHIEVGVAQTLVSIIPVLIIPFVILFYKERVSSRAIAGAVVAVAGVAMLLWN